jgi:K+-transporting ATPase ATPase A chain
MEGMMVGRPPEYLGKPIDPPVMKLIGLYALLGPATILLLTALAAVTAWGLAGLTLNRGPHGLSEIVYAYASSMANNARISRASMPIRPSIISPLLARCW